MTPSLATADVAISLSVYILAYAVIYWFGLHYIYRLLRDGPATEDEPADATPGRPLAVAAQAALGGQP